jgi:hypothetical protein
MVPHTPPTKTCMWLSWQKMKKKYKRRRHTVPSRGGKFFLLHSYRRDDMDACKNLTPYADIITLIAKSKFKMISLL